MKTSKQWWEEVKADTAKFNEWLAKQFVGEVTAAHRINKLGEQFSQDKQTMRTLQIISVQEMTHAQWIGELMEARGLEIPRVRDAENRYWRATMNGIKDFETGAAVAAHAEKMRLERIQVICDDEDSPADVREVFQKILKEEIFHEKAFRGMSSITALEATLGNHELGLTALGLAA